jgi:biopolymer transport protein ExbD
MAMAIGKLPDSGDDAGEEGGESIFAEINITPLTDVFLVMVIIFMVSALAVQVEARQQKQKITKQQQEMAEIEKRSGLRVNLPSGQAQEIDPSKASLVLVIPINGDVNVGGKNIPDAELDNLLRAAYTRDKLTQVIIKADKGVAHGRVVNIMERAKGVGLTRLAIGTSGG